MEQQHPIAADLIMLQDLDAPLSKEELFAALQEMHSGKVPGSSVLPMQFLEKVTPTLLSHFFTMVEAAGTAMIIPYHI